jgi:hypothetical protein
MISAFRLLFLILASPYLSRSSNNFVSAFVAGALLTDSFKPPLLIMLGGAETDGRSLASRSLSGEVILVDDEPECDSV